MPDLKISFDIWQLVSLVGGVVVWFFRLEGRVNGLERERDLQSKLIDSLQNKFASIEGKLGTEISEIKETLAVLVTKLEIFMSKDS